MTLLPLQASSSRRLDSCTPRLFLREIIGIIRVSSSKVWKQHQPTNSSNGKQANQGRDSISLLDLKVFLIHGFLGLVA